MNLITPATKYSAVLALFFACLPLPALAMVNINTATQAQLESLQGVGPTYAARIIAYRQEHGGFTTIEEIQEVKGIGPATYAAIKDSISIDYVAPPPQLKPKPIAEPTHPPGGETSRRGLTAIPKAQAAFIPNTAETVDPTIQYDGAEPAFPIGAAVVGLLALVGLGSIAAWYIRSQALKVKQDEETEPTADEFDIS